MGSAWILSIRRGKAAQWHIVGANELGAAAQNFASPICAALCGVPRRSNPERERPRNAVKKTEADSTDHADLADLRPLARLWHLHCRLVVAGAVGFAAVMLLLVFPLDLATRILIGWDIGVAVYLALICGIMAHESIAKIRHRASTNDEGAIALLVLTTAATMATLAAVIAELGQARGPYQILLGIGTIVFSWAFMHSIFALHYAHEYYGAGRDKQIGGLTFPGKDDPDYWDFLYYSLVVAMTAQVSDVQITSKTIRRLTMVHGTISFFFNTIVLALAVSIVSGVMQPNH